MASDTTPAVENLFADVRAKRRRKELLFRFFLMSSVASLSLVLLYLVGSSFWRGKTYLTLSFLENFPSRFPSKAGLKAAWVGSLWIISICAVLCLSVGTGAAIYLEELAPRKTGWQQRLSRWVEINIGNLSGVPSIVYGILGLAVFARFFDLGRSIISAALTLSLMVLPTVIIASREAIRSVPQSVRHAAYALGATQWQTVIAHVLPAATPGILTGLILAISRAIGEAAPLILVGGLVFVTYTPANIFDGYTVLPIQIFNWASRPQQEFQDLAAAGIIVLLGVLLLLNGTAIAIRLKFEKFQNW